tara:strand:- start:774 stop:983 length:210 start_codon:yes stop_codon:yes gene_type:complete
MTKYQNIIQRCLQEQYKRIDELLTLVPDGIDLGKDKTASEAAVAVLSIEEEWIIDPVLREQLTMLHIDE